MAGDETEKFVKRWAQVPECTLITLWSCAADSTRMLCDTWKVTAPNDAEIRELWEQIEERALRQANTFGGSQAFVLEATNIGRRPLGTEIFRVYGEALPGATGSAIATEPANEAGHTAQMMRHNEALTRTFVNASERQMKSLLSQIELSDRRAASSEERSLKALEMISTIATQEREREVALRKVDSDNALRNTIAGKVMNLLPAVAGSIMGKKPGGQELAAMTQMKGILENLKGPQMEKILEALDPEQALALVKLIKEMHAAGMLGEAKPDEGPTTH